MNEAVDRVIIERARLDAGLSNSFFVSLTGHMVLVAVAVVAPFLVPKPPALQVTDGFAVVLPRGGGGSPPAAEPPEAKPAPKPQEQPPAPAPAPTAPPKVLKPPREQAPPPDALPEPDSRRRARKATPPAPAPRAAGRSGQGAATPGLEFGPPGPGVPGGTDSGGDWYLAGVQQKIWTLWNQQIKSGFTHPIGVTFTIVADGSVTNVRVTQPSGASLLDMAAQRAILNAAPFGPLPRQYGTDRKTVRAVFRPTDG